MRNTARLLAALLSLIAGPALAQNVPANSVQGRLGIPAAGGPVQSIPFSLLAPQLGIPPVANSTLGTVQVWPVPSSIPNAVGNLIGFNASGVTLGCNALSPTNCLQAAINAALPSTGAIFTQDFQRDIELKLGYAGDHLPVTWPGYQNVFARITGTGFLDATHDSCEMCDFQYIGTQLFSWVFNPVSQGAPGGDSLFQQVDSRFFATTVFNVSFPRPSFTNNELGIIELNADPQLVSGTPLFNVPSVGPSQNWGSNNFTVVHAHSNGHTTDYFKIGDGTPSVGQRFGNNFWNLHIDNTGGLGTENGFVSYASKDIKIIRSDGFTSTGKNIWYRSGAQDNILILQADAAVDPSVAVTDANGTASRNLQIVGGYGIYFGGSQYMRSDTHTRYGFAYADDAANARGTVINTTGAATDGQVLVGQTASVPRLKTISGDATLAASGALTVSSIGGVAIGTSGNTIPKNNTANIWTGSQIYNFNVSTAPTRTASGLQLVATDGSAIETEIDTFATNGALRFSRANGTNASRTALAVDNMLGSVRFQGYGATGYGSATAAFAAFASQTWTDANQGTYVDLQSTPLNSTTLTTALRITSDLGLIAPTTVTGGSKGAGTINASGLYDGGNRVATLAGTNAFTGANSFPVGGGAGTIKPSGILSTQTTATGNAADNVEATLQSYSLPLSSFNTNGQILKITAWGLYGATAHNKRFRLYFGSSILGGSGIVTTSGSNWYAQAIITRSGASTQTYNLYFVDANGVQISSTTTAETDTSAIVIKTTGQVTSGATTANDVQGLGLTVEASN